MCVRPSAWLDVVTMSLMHDFSDPFVSWDLICFPTEEQEAGWGMENRHVAVMLNRSGGSFGHWNRCSFTSYFSSRASQTKPLESSCWIRSASIAAAMALPLDPVTKSWVFSVVLMAVWSLESFVTRGTWHTRLLQEDSRQTS
jgi:hypothetical protein